MNNTILKNGTNVVSLDTAKKAYVSNPLGEKQNDNTVLVDSYLKQLDWKVNENSNMSYSIQGLNNYIASEVSKTYWLNKIYNEKCTEKQAKAYIASKFNYIFLMQKAEDSLFKISSVAELTLNKSGSLVLTEILKYEDGLYRYNFDEN